MDLSPGQRERVNICKCLDFNLSESSVDILFRLFTLCTMRLLFIEVRQILNKAGILKGEYISIEATK